ncbi:hypothetical protein VCCP1035_2148A, partial [Vibrio cholerae CP1035(8)]
MGCTEC